jgi:lysozyme family protein
MATFSKAVFEQLISHEGGFVNDPSDPGGPTNLGITLDTWRRYGKDLDNDGDIDVMDLRLLNKPLALPVYKSIYWDAINLDNVRSQGIADIVFDHGVNCAPWRAASMVQYILKNDFDYNLNIDGNIGPLTVSLVNACDQKRFFELYKQLRKDYYLRRVGELPDNHPVVPFLKSIKLEPSPKAKKYKKGWLDRVSHFTFVP